MSYAARIRLDSGQKREYKRVDVLAPVVFKAMEGYLLRSESHGVALDVSPDGIFIQTSDPMNVDEMVDIDVNLIQIHEHIAATGKVVRSDDSGFAVRFSSRCERLDTVKAI